MATATLLPGARSVFFDANGNPLAGGFVHTYIPGGTTPKTTWQDAGEATPNANPIVLDSAGSCLLYGSGSYQLTVTDALGNSIPAYCGVTADTGTALTAFEASLAAQTAGNGTTLVGYLGTATGAVGETLSTKLGQVYSVADFGAVADGATDATAAIQAGINALSAAGGTLYFQAGVYKTSSTLTIPTSAITLAGAGRLATVIKSSVAAVPVITIGASLSGTVIKDMTLDRSVAATAGGNGINAILSVDATLFSNLLVQNQRVGFALGATSFSLVDNCTASFNLDAGFLIQNSAGNGAAQWSLSNCLSSRNVGQGYLFSAVAGPITMALGEVNSCSTYANTGGGLFAVGLVGTPINGLRITGGFYGGDGNHEIYLDTYGGEHKLVGVFTEQPGLAATGPTFAVAASHVGSGFFFTANNIDIQADGCYAEGCSASGFVSSATEVMFTGCKAINNGLGAIAGDQNGFNIPAGRASIGMIRAGNLGGNTSQLFGLKIANGASGHVVCGADLTGNTTGPTSITTATNTTLVGVVPNGNYLQPGGGMVLGAASGAATAGVLNVVTGVQLNGTNYTNP